MADTQVTTNIGGSLITDKRKTPTGSSPLSATGFAATKDITAMRAQLQTLNAAYYTNARLNTMSKNDMVYALRVGYDSAGL